MWTTAIPTSSPPGVAAQLAVVQSIHHLDPLVQQHFPADNYGAFLTEMLIAQRAATALEMRKATGCAQEYLVAGACSRTRASRAVAPSHRRTRSLSEAGIQSLHSGIREAHKGRRGRGRRARGRVIRGRKGGLYRVAFSHAL